MKHETNSDRTIKLRRFGENAQFFVDQRLNMPNSKRLYKSYVDMLDEKKTEYPWERRRNKSVDIIRKAPVEQKEIQSGEYLPKLRRNSNNKNMKSVNFD